MQTPLSAEPGASPRPRFAPEASIVLVGIRGSGKRSLGFIAAAALGRRYITEDHFFQSLTGFSRQEFLRIHGSEEFHKQDVEISRRMLDDNKQGCVIDCGLGSLTRSLQDYLKTYCLTNPVIYVQRDMSSIKRLLRLSDRSAKLLESGDPSHRRCSNFEFFNVEDSSAAFEDEEDDRGSPIYSFKLREVQTDFAAFVQHLTGQSQDRMGEASPFSIHASLGTKLFTHALVIPVSTYRTLHVDFTTLQAGGDIVEVLIDEWREGTARLVTQLVAKIRRYMQVPVLISAMNIDESFPINTYFAALRHAIRLAPEYLSADLGLEKGWISEFTRHQSCTQVIGSVYYKTATALNTESDLVIAQVEKAISLGMKMIRVTAPATTRFDSDQFDQFVRSLRHRYSSRLHFSAFLGGNFGRTSQLFNPILTPVTHSNLKADDAPTTRLIPQITSRQALEGLFASFTLDPLRFFVFGANVSDSLSPAMHNAGYQTVGLRHNYRAVNVTSWDEIRSYARMFDFGGASVAQPFKVKILDQLSSLSEHARGIGAINTLLPLRGDDKKAKAAKDQSLFRNRAGPVHGFYGDNSDWISIQSMLNKSLSPRNVIHSKSTALIVGAGGMARAAAYALLQMGCRNIFVYNRTISNAEILTTHFANWAKDQNYTTPASIQVLKTCEQPWPEGFAQPTIIISCITHERLPGEEHVADFTVPEAWLRSESGGAAVEQAYYINTPFIQQIKQLQSTTGKPWVIVDGLEVLHAQATTQFEMMTGRKAPRVVMWETLQDAVSARNGRV